MSSKKWNIINKVKSHPFDKSFDREHISNRLRTKAKSEDLLNVLLENRGIKTKSEKKDFLNPDLLGVNPKSVGIDAFNLEKAIKRIEKAIKDNEHVIVYGDYDVDGICGAAILWETLTKMGAKVLPFIPSRFEEGYGLSIKGIENVLSKDKDIKLIITVDNGIVANQAVDFANKEKIDVIITDHHVAVKNLPKAFAIVHTTAMCGAGVAYLLSKEINNQKSNLKNKTLNTKLEIPDTHLELVALATIADLVPLVNANRILVYFGLKALQNTNRPGLLALFKASGIDKSSIGVYEVGYIIGPRLNAMGRLESAMDSLRLICTQSLQRAKILADQLNTTNLERKIITQESLNNARLKAKDKIINNLIFIADSGYQQGVIGLIAGRLVEEFYVPSIVVSKGKIFSKASVRSVKGFNIIEFLREASDLFVDLGGHPMAAGFTVENKNLEILEKRLYALAGKLINKTHLERFLNIDLELLDELINTNTFELVKKLEPFGMANPQPLFITNNLRVLEVRLLGQEGKHLKLKLRSLNGIDFDAIAFGMGKENSIRVGDIISAVYILEENEWSGSKKLQLKIKDIKKN